MATLESGSRFRQIDGAGKKFALLLNVGDRVLGEVRQRMVDLGLLAFYLPVEVRLQLFDPGGDSHAVPDYRSSFENHMFVLDQDLEQVLLVEIDQPHPCLDQNQRSPVRVPVIRGGVVVEDHLDPAGDQVLGCDAIDVPVADHRDISRLESLDEVLCLPPHPDPPGAPARCRVLPLRHGFVGPPSQPSGDRVHPTRVMASSGSR